MGVGVENVGRKDASIILGRWDGIKWSIFKKTNILRDVSTMSLMVITEEREVMGNII